VQFNCLKELHEKLNWMFSGTAQVSHQVYQFFVNSVCLLVRVTMVAVVCCLLATSAMMWSEKKKQSVKCGVRSGIWKGIYHVMLIWRMNCWKRMGLEMMPSWCRQINWGNCRIPWLNCAVLCVKDDWKGQFWGLRYLPVKSARFTQFFCQVWRHTVKSLSLTESV